MGANLQTRLYWFFCNRRNSLIRVQDSYAALKPTLSLILIRLHVYKLYDWIDSRSALLLALLINFTNNCIVLHASLLVTKTHYLASHAECTLLRKCCCLLRICRERVAAIILAVVNRFASTWSCRSCNHRLWLQHTRFSELMFDAHELLDFSSMCATDSWNVTFRNSLITTINLVIWSLM